MGLLSDAVMSIVRATARSLRAEDGVQPTRLCCTKKKTAKENYKELQKIEGPDHPPYKAQDYKTILLSRCIAPAKLTLKVKYVSASAQTPFGRSLPPGLPDESSCLALFARFVDAARRSC